MRTRLTVLIGVCAPAALLFTAIGVPAGGRVPLAGKPGYFVANQNGRPPAVLPIDDPVEEPASAKKLKEVPAWTWCYGCANTAAGMIMGYYDRHGYPNMYAGNAGTIGTTALTADAAAAANRLCPLNNETAWPDRMNDPTLGESPLAACHLGIDGRLTRGYVDECWIGSENANPDPWIMNGWTLHEPPCSLADAMWTSRYDKYNIDGATQFIFASLGDPVRDFDDWEPDLRDGSHGMRLYAELRGYSVADNYNQLILPTPAGQHNIWGFDFDDYKAEIDAGRPVMLMAGPHTFVGFGYGDNETCYIRTTWDNDEHTMKWGGRYGGYEHWAVSVLQLDSPPADTYPDLLLKAPGDSGFKGNGVYDNLTEQSTTRPVKPNTSITYEFNLQNDATVGDVLTVKGTAGTAVTGTPAWTVQYLDQLTGATDITTEVTSATGWPVTLASKEARPFRAIVTPNGAVPEGGSYDITVSVKSGGNARRVDAWKITTVRRKSGVEPTITPSSVTGLKATRTTGTTKATIVFKRCAQDNYGCAKYNLYRQCLNPKGSMTLLKTITATGAASYKVFDTSAGAVKPYNYTVKAVNGSNVSEPSTVPLLDPAVTPTNPTKLSAARINGDTTRAKVQWTKSAEDPNAVSHYNIYRRCTTDGSSWAQVGSVPRSGSATRYTFNDSGLEDSKAYEYGVTAYNGTKHSGRPTCVLQDAPYDPNVTPRMPTDLVAARNTTIGMTKAKLTIYKSPDDKSGCTEYRIYRRTIPPPYGAWKDVTTIAATGAAEYTYTDTGLLKTKDYQYAAVAYNGTTKHSGTQMTTLTNPNADPGLPADLILADYGSSGTQVEVTIMPAPNDPRGVTNYGLYRRTVNPDTAWKQIAVGNSDGSSSYGYIDSGLTAGREYAYAVISVNNNKQSDFVERHITPGGGGSSLVAQAVATQTPAGAQLLVRLTASASLSVDVVNIAGRPIRRLCTDKPCEAGQTTLLWDARSDAGTRVPPGRYLVRITARAEGGAQAQTLATLALQ